MPEKARKSPKKPENARSLQKTSNPHENAKKSKKRGKNASIYLQGKTFDKTREIVVIPNGTKATIVGSDENWSTYYSGSDEFRRGVFISGRTVTLSPYAMSAYQVTQELYKAVMGDNPSIFNGVSEKEPANGENQELRPVENVNWYGNIVSGSVVDLIGATSGASRVGRGGSWSDVACIASVSYWDDYNPHNPHSDLGFRLVRSL